MVIVILDTNCANLASVRLAIEKLGYTPIVTSNPEIASNADKLLLPGVGSAFTVMNQLKKKKIISVIKNSTCPTLGICLGMQLLSTFSEESHGIHMIGVIDSHVKLLNSKKLPLPHTGWNQVINHTGNPLFNGIKEGAWFYFLHSYVFPINQYTISQSYYGTYFSAAVQKDNFFGVQFHPEKSGSIGAHLLLNFLEM